MKGALIVGAVAAASSWLVSKYGASLEAQAVKMHIPPNIAHLTLVGSATGVAYWVTTKFM